MTKKLANRFSNSVGNSWHSQVIPSIKRKLNLKNKKKGKK